MSCFAEGILSGELMLFGTLPQEPKVVEVFEQLWKTKELIVSYDAM